MGNKLYLIGGSAGIGKTSYVVKTANSLSSSGKVLLISMETEKNTLLNDYHLNSEENIEVIDKPINVEEIKKQIESIKPNYVLVDYLQLLETNIKNDSVKVERIKYLLDTLKDYVNAYGIDVYVTDYISSKEDKTKYTNSIYSVCDSILILDI